MPRVIHFEVHAADPDRIAAFYAEMFGWKLTKWDGPLDYWVIVTGPDGTPGINGGLVKRHGAKPVSGQAVNAFVCTLDVPDVDAAVAKGLALGGVLALAKMAVPGVGWLAYLQDPEGTVFGMMQSDPTAA